jgi:hypothetical protein
MANIPPDKPAEQLPLDPKTNPNPTDSKISVVGLTILTQTSDGTTFTAPPNVNPNTDSSKTTEKTNQVAISYFRPRSLTHLRMSAIAGPNPSNLLQIRDLELKDLFLKKLKPPFPSREVFQRIIDQIKNVDTLLEIWTELILKPEDDSLEDLLVDVFQAIYQKNRDSSCEAYSRINLKDKLRKRIADCIARKDFKFFFHETLKPPYPSREVFQRIIEQIKNVKTLLEIWTELLHIPENDSIEDLLVDVFQAIYQLNIDSSWTAYTKTGQRNEIKKRIADCIKPKDFEFFLEKVYVTDDPFSMVLFLKKRFGGTPGNREDFFERGKICDRKKNEHAYLHTVTPIMHINWVIPDDLRYISLSDFQQLCVNFCKTGWGTKEEFVTKALCNFWNEIIFSDRLSIYNQLKNNLEKLENGILDIGEVQDQNLLEGNNPLFVFLFLMGILYPKVQEKIQASKTSFSLKPKDLEEDYASIEPGSKRLINKMRTLLLSPLEAVKILEETDLNDEKSWPCVTTKYRQFSGSCVVKNFNSLLSMSSAAPSIIMHGGFQGHSVYAEVFKLGRQYFALVHDLGSGLKLHMQDKSNKILPLALYFENFDSLNYFCREFCRKNSTEEAYLALVKQFAEDYVNLVDQFALSDALIRSGVEVKKEENLQPFVLSLSRPSGHKSPMHSVYREFRKLQREIIRMLIDPTGSPSQVKVKASTRRKEQKKR